MIQIIIQSLLNLILTDNYKWWNVIAIKKKINAENIAVEIQHL